MDADPIVITPLLVSSALRHAAALQRQSAAAPFRRRRRRRTGAAADRAARLDEHSIEWSPDGSASSRSCRIANPTPTFLQLRRVRHRRQPERCPTAHDDEEQRIRPVVVARREDARRDQGLKRADDVLRDQHRKTRTSGPSTSQPGQRREIGDAIRQPPGRAAVGADGRCAVLHRAVARQRRACIGVLRRGRHRPSACCLPRMSQARGSVRVRGRTARRVCDGDARRLRPELYVEPSATGGRSR